MLKLTIHTDGLRNAPSVLWAPKYQPWTLADEISRQFAETPAPAVKKSEPKEPKPGNQEREIVFRVVAAVEKALGELPQAQAQVAGFLQGKEYVGDKTAEHNALAKYLADQVWRTVNLTEPTLVQHLSKVQVWVEANGTIIESPAYQVALNPVSWQETFINRLRAGDFPALLD